MAYTRPWDPSLPDGDVLDADDIDGEFRRLKEDFEERLEDTLFVDMTADPLVFKDTLGFNKSKRINIDYSEFKFSIEPSSLTDTYCEWTNTAALVGYAPVILPDAVEITGMLTYYQRVDGSGANYSGTMALLANNHGTFGVTTVASAAGLANTSVSNPLTSFTHTIDLGNNWYKLKFSLNDIQVSADKFRLFMVTLLYTSPNAGATL